MRGHRADHGHAVSLGEAGHRGGGAVHVEYRPPSAAFARYLKMKRLFALLFLLLLLPFVLPLFALIYAAARVNLGPGVFFAQAREIGRASRRDRVCRYV